MYVGVREKVVGRLMGGEVTESSGRWADQVGVTKDMMKRTLRGLREEGFVEVERHVDWDGGSLASTYRLSPKAFEAAGSLAVLLRKTPARVMAGEAAARLGMTKEAVLDAMAVLWARGGADRDLLRRVQVRPTPPGRPAARRAA